MVGARLALYSGTMRVSVVCTMARGIGCGTVVVGFGRCGVNYNTVARVYLDLGRDGVVSTRRGRGTFVAGEPDEERVARARQEKLQAIMRGALREARVLGYDPDETKRALEEESMHWRGTGEG